jgi:RNA polymerase sigma-70 factor (ECF subfamily)
LKRFNQSKNFKTWLFTIAKNTAYDFLKKKKTLPFSYYTDGEGHNKLECIADSKLSPDDLAKSSDQAHELIHLLEKTPVHYRAILLLHYKQGFSLKKTAKILEKPYNTVKSQHLRALRYINKNFPKI